MLPHNQMRNLFQYDLMKAHTSNLEVGMGRLGVLGNSWSAFLCYDHLGVLGSKLGLEVVAVPGDDLNQRTARFWQQRLLGGTAAKGKIQHEHPHWFMPATAHRNACVSDHNNPTLSTAALPWTLPMPYQQHSSTTCTEYYSSRIGRRWSASIPGARALKLVLTR